jgi:hypothetical protein
MLSRLSLDNMNPKKLVLILSFATLATLVLGTAMVNAIPSEHPHFGTLGVIKVNSNGLYYDTFAPTIVPYTGQNDGSFQQLYDDGSTDFGPGDPGYRGGRWWIDDGDGYIGPEDTFVLCPLFGPGRESP